MLIHNKFLKKYKLERIKFKNYIDRGLIFENNHQKQVKIHEIKLKNKKIHEIAKNKAILKQQEENKNEIIWSTKNYYNINNKYYNYNIIDNNIIISNNNTIIIEQSLDHFNNNCFFATIIINKNIVSGLFYIYKNKEREKLLFIKFNLET